MSDESGGPVRLSPEAVRQLYAFFAASSSDRVRDLLAAAAGGDREVTTRLAAGLAGDAAALQLEELRLAAVALGEAAAGDGPLGAATLELARAYGAARARFDAGSPPSASP